MHKFKRPRAHVFISTPWLSVYDQMKASLVIVLLAAVTKIGVSCASSTLPTLSDLFKSQYPEVYYPPAEDEDGLGLPPSLLTPVLTEPGFLHRLEHFEEDPMAVFNNKAMKDRIISTCMPNYLHNEVSMEIIDKMFEYGAPPDFVLDILKEAIRLDLEELFDKIIESYSFAEWYEKNPKLFSNDRPLYRVILSTANYKYAKKLMMRGYDIGPPIFLAKEACNNGNLTKVDKTIEFLDYIIVQRKDFGVNEPIWPINQAKERILHYLLRGNSDRIFKENVGKYLIRNGADPMIPDVQQGRNTYEIADSIGVNLH